MKISPKIWTSSPDYLFQVYRGFIGNEKQNAKIKLALATLIHVIKTVAYGILAGFSFLRTCATRGKFKNNYADQTFFHAHLARIAFSALFHFKPVMEEMRIAEARAFYLAAVANPPPQTKIPEAELNEKLFEKLKKLNATQLKQTLAYSENTLYFLASGKERVFINLLLKLQQEGNDAIKKVIDAQMVSVQKDYYSQYQTILGICKNPTQESAKIVFIKNPSDKEIEILCPELKSEIKNIQTKKEFKPLSITNEQYEFLCLLDQSSHRIQGGFLLFQTFLKVAAKIGNGEAKTHFRFLLKDACINEATYMGLLKGSPTLLGKEEIETAEKVAKILDQKDLLLQCFICQVEALEKEQWPAGPQLQKIAKEGFDLFERKGAANLNHATVDALLKCLVKDLSGSWLQGRTQQNLQALVLLVNSLDVQYVDQNYPKPIWYVTQLIEWSLTTGNLTLLNLQRYLAIDSSCDDHLTKIWQECQNEATKRASLAPFYAMNRHLQFPYAGFTYKCPKLAQSILDYAKQPINIAAAPKECELILLNQLDNCSSSPIIQEGLPLALQHDLPTLRDTCVNALLNKLPDVYGWLNENPDLIADALNATKREASWKKELPFSQQRCAQEGLLLLKYAAQNSHSKLGSACKEYVSRNPAYLSAVSVLYDADKKEFLELAARLYL